MKDADHPGMRRAPASAKCIDVYDNVVLGHAKIIVLLLVCVFSYLGYRIKDFRIDASADALILEHDEDLRYFRTVIAKYGTSDYLLLTYTPREDLFADETLVNLRALRDELRGLDRVSSVVSVLDVPLLSNPPVSLKELKDNIKTLESPDADKELARDELSDSPLYQDMLVSPDMRTTAIRVDLVGDAVLSALLQQRTRLRDREHTGTITPEERIDLKRVAAKYSLLSDRANRQRHEDIRAVREVMDRHRSSADLFLGGVPMIADDMISFVRSDLKVFGLGMLAFLVLTLAVIFRRTIWVALPMLCCVCSAISMMGGLGISDWKVTVVSSNFISLQLIITMALAIHLVVRYREVQAASPDAGHRELIRETVRTIFMPCLYTALTTIAGFCSLIICDILPVIDFGWMMTMGIVLSLSVTFLLFPACLMLMPMPTPARNRRFGFSATAHFARFTRQHAVLIFGGALVVVAGTLIGISKLEVENSFINYFKKTTEIYRGMTVIDRKLGGTTPLDIIINFEDDGDAKHDGAAGGEPEDGMFDEFDEFDSAEDDDKYWYTLERIELIGRAHDYLESVPEIGKVLSLTTMMRIAESLRGAEEWDTFELALLFNEFPDDFRKMVLDPYVSVEENEARLTVRIKDSMKSLRRNALLARIRRDLENEVGLENGQVNLAGVMVLYNNMLQSLFRSQIQTIGYTVLAIMAMFMVLFRSLKVSLIAIFPNLMASLVVLGVMGLLGIPLDMMTITIVAISIGIAVDNTIHYIHRFRHEFETDHDYMKTMFRCHGSIGNAMYYTSITIIIGFSILALSEFIPTILFGLFTALAMAMALVAALTLLPRMIILFRAFGPGIAEQGQTISTAPGRAGRP
ncbi:RND family transporter [Verrucomicrobiota bacterium]